MILKTTFTIIPLLIINLPLYSKEINRGVRSLPEMVYHADCIIMGSVYNIDSTTFEILKINNIKGDDTKCPENMGIQRNSFNTTIRWKPLKSGDTSVYFLKNFDNTGFRIMGEFLEGEAPVRGASVYFEQGLFSLYDDLIQTQVGLNYRTGMQGYRDGNTEFKAKKFKLKESIQAILNIQNLLMNRLTFYIEPKTYNDFVQSNQNNFSYEEKLFLRYAFLVSKNKIQ